MPEASEVEIVRRQLEVLCGQRLLEVEAEPRLELSAHLDELDDEPLLEQVRRRGKQIGLQLSGGLTISCHLRMTGVLSLERPPAPRARLRFERDELFFADPRGFGTLSLGPTGEFAAKLGPDLLTETAGRPQRKPRGRRAVKAVLLDQSVIAGIGNYLADEALWECAIHPARPLDAISAEQWQQLIRAARETAQHMLERGGVSMRDYRQLDGSEGAGQEDLNCYGRAGKPCRYCKTTLAKSKVAGRGTTFCPSCQKPSA